MKASQAKMKFRKAFLVSKRIRKRSALNFNFFHFFQLAGFSPQVVIKKISGWIPQSVSTIKGGGGRLRNQDPQSRVAESAIRIHRQKAQNLQSESIIMGAESAIRIHTNNGDRIHNQGPQAKDAESAIRIRNKGGSESSKKGRIRQTGTDRWLLTHILYMYTVDWQYCTVYRYINSAGKLFSSHKKFKFFQILYYWKIHMWPGSLTTTFRRLLSLVKKKQV